MSIKNENDTIFYVFFVVVFFVLLFIYSYLLIFDNDKDEGDVLGLDECLRQELYTSCIKDRCFDGHKNAENLMGACDRISQSQSKRKIKHIKSECLSWRNDGKY